MQDNRARQEPSFNLFIQENKTDVERMTEYQQAWRKPAPQSFTADLEPSWNLRRYDDRHNMFLFYVNERETFIVNVRFKILYHVM